MKLSDINQKLTEQPGGFGGIVKAKAKKHMPFAKGTRRRGKAEEALLKGARKIKDALNDWKNKAFRSTGGEKAPLTMNQFLGWVRKSQPKYAKGIEAFARGSKAYAAYFSQAVDKKGKQSSTASDPKVKRRGGEGEQSEEEIRAAYKKQGEELETKRKAQGGELVDEDEGDDEKDAPVSASIYEARLRAILEAEGDPDPDVDVAVSATKTLKDDQIDTLITMGIEKQIELDGGESIVDEPSEITSKSSSKGAPDDSEDSDLGGGASSDFLSEYQDELETVLTKVKNGAELDKRDRSNANNMLRSL